jgi:hypothetical protein
LLAAVLCLGLLIRLPFVATDSGISGDLGFFRQWARTIHEEGLVVLAQTTNTPIYQPIALYLMGLAGWLEALSPAVWRGGDGLLNALIKLPPMVADVLIAALAAWALPGHAAGRRIAAAALYVFNPAVWYLSTYWGQIDPLYVLCMAVSVLALARPAIVPAWVAYALGVMTKLQAIFLGPLVFIVSLRPGNRPRLVGGLAISVALAVVLTAPWWATGHFRDFIQATLFPPTDLDISAYNLWYLLRLGVIRGVSADLHPPGLPFSYRLLSLGLFGAFVLLVMFFVWYRGPGAPLVIPAALFSMASFMLLPHMRERYLLPALFFVLSGAAGEEEPRLRPKLWCIYGLLTATLLFNLVTISSFAPTLWLNLVVQQPPYAPHIAALKGLSLLAAAVNVGVMVWLTLLLWRGRESGVKRET